MEKLNILIVDRPLKNGENEVKDIFNVYGKKYDLIMFPSKEDDPECRVQFVSFNYNLIFLFQELLGIHISYDEDENYYDFNTTQIKYDDLIDIFKKGFKLIYGDLTAVESNKTVSNYFKFRNRNLDLIGTGRYCPDCSGPCGNSKHDRKKW